MCGIGGKTLASRVRTGHSVRGGATYSTFSKHGATNSSLGNDLHARTEYVGRVPRKGYTTR